MVASPVSVVQRMKHPSDRLETVHLPVFVLGKMKKPHVVLPAVSAVQRGKLGYVILVAVSVSPKEKQGRVKIMPVLVVRRVKHRSAV